MKRASAKRGPYVLDFPREKKQTFSLSQIPPAGMSSVPLPTGLSPQSHQLQLRLDKNKPQAIENSARMHFIEGNDNVEMLPILFGLSLIHIVQGTRPLASPNGNVSAF